MRSELILAALAAAGLGLAAIATPAHAAIDFQRGVSPTVSFDVPDTTIRSDGSGVNPDSGVLYLGNHDIFRAVLSFDLTAGGLSAGDPIQSVQLVLTKSGTSNSWDTKGSDRQLDVHLLTRNFVESDVTWADYSSGNAWTNAGGDYNSTVLSTLIESAANNGTDTFDSTAAFKTAAADALNNNNGILNLIVIAPKTTNTNAYLSFYSSEAGKTYRPKLIVTVPEPGSAALLALAGLGTLGVRRRRRL